ncbi:MAG: type II toxin-antitoxin system RelE/ParE family toxin [Hyphomicrobiaceae bacterium]
MNLRWTLEASEDLEDVLSYIASRNPIAAASVAEQIERSVTSLAEFPRAGRRNPASGALEWAVPGLPLLIIYTIPTADLVEVIALFHTSRDPSTKRRP